MLTRLNYFWNPDFEWNSWSNSSLGYLVRYMYVIRINKFQDNRYIWSSYIRIILIIFNRSNILIFCVNLIYLIQVVPVPAAPLSSSSSGLKSKIRKVFRTTSGPDRNFSLVSQLTSAALCASSPALPKSSDVPPVVKSLLRPLSVPQLR